MAIEAARQAVQLTILPPATVEALRQSARLRATHYSTRIEGNRLTFPGEKPVFSKKTGFSAGWLEAADPARKSRRYRLLAGYRRFVGGITADP
jgi:hypothetical protein